MTTPLDLELAALAYQAYATSDENSLLPPEWQEDTTLARSSLSGFAAKVFTKGAEVVISFRGTDFGPINDLVRDFQTGNIPAAIGNQSAQVSEAIKLVADVMHEYGPAITLTGHSLGGGLASLMAVFFDLDAVVFDPAPFAITAMGEWVPMSPLSGYVGPAILEVAGKFRFPSKNVERYFDEYQNYQMAKGRPLSGAFGSYSQNFESMYEQRKTRVEGYYLDGEVLEGLRTILPTAVPTANLHEIQIGNTTLNEAWDRFTTDSFLGGVVECAITF